MRQAYWIMVGFGIALCLAATMQWGSDLIFSSGVVQVGDADTAADFTLADGTANYLGMGVTNLSADWDMTWPIPPAGDNYLINVDIDGTMSTVDPATVGSGAPSTATYITQVAEAGLSAEQALGVLATGILKNTTATGVLSIAAAGTDYYAPGGTDVAVVDGGTGLSAITDKAILYADGTNDFGFDATNFFWDDTLNASCLTIGSGTAGGATRWLEGSGGGTSYFSITAPAALAGNVVIIGFTALPGSNLPVLLDGSGNLTTGALTVPQGGTGAVTLTGLIKGNGTSAMTVASQGTDYYAPSGTDVAVLDGGTGASDASNARNNLAAAPNAATYIVQTANGELSAEQVLGSLATGIVKNTTTTGVLSIAAQGTDYYAPGGTDVAVLDGGTGASDAANARANLSAAKSGINSDITSMSGLTGTVGSPTQLSIAEGVTAGNTASAVNVCAPTATDTTLMWNTEAGNSIYGSGTIYSSYSEDSIANSSSIYNFAPASAFGSKDIAANGMNAGRTIRVTAAGVCDVGGGPSLTLTFTILLDAVTLITAQTGTLPSATNDNDWRLQVEITCWSIGSTGTVNAHGVLWCDGDTMSPTPITTYIFNNADRTLTVDTTQALTVNVAVTMDQADPTNVVDCRQFVVEILN